jgi:uncharacterized membrane protein
VTPLRSLAGIERGDKVTRLEAFVDASFAFALTLLVISGDSIPTSIEALNVALKQIPSYALSFVLIAQFWSSHARWGRWFGLDDDISNRLSLLLVFLLLIFVYPLKMVFGAFFHAITSGSLPASFAVRSDDEMLNMFQVFAVGYGAMAMVMALLYWRAAAFSDALGLSPVERLLATHHRGNWLFVVAFTLASFLLASFMPSDRPIGIWLGLPGFILFGLYAVQLIRWRVYLLRLKRMSTNEQA